MLTYDANMSCGPVASSCSCEAAPVATPAPCGCEAPVAAEPCGCDAAPAVESCGCDAAPAVESCGCDAAPATAPKFGGLNLFSKLCKNSCGAPEPAIAPVADCGCSAPVEAPVADCGCEAPTASPCGELNAAKKPFSLGLFNRFKTPAASAAADCGCGAPEPVVSDCGCGSSAPVEAAPAADCGCSAAVAAPVSDCGCEVPVSPCGNSAVAPCGCNDGSRGKLSLLDRLRGNRIPRTRDGVVIGSACNDGCNPPCPAQPSDCGCGGAPVPQVAAPCTSCGGGEVIYTQAQPSTGCSSCGTSQGEVIYGTPVAAATATAAGSEEAAPVAPPADTETTPMATEGVIESVPGAPVVDPGAFIPRRRTTIGS
jgi:hypothetical protein